MNVYTVFNKDMNTFKCLCVISLSRLCFSIVVIWMKIRSNVVTTLKSRTFPKASHTFSCYCIYYVYCVVYSVGNRAPFGMHEALMKMIMSGQRERETSQSQIQTACEGLQFQKPNLQDGLRLYYITG